MNGFALSGAIRASSPKGGALGRNRKFIVLPRPLPLRKTSPAPGEDVTAGDKRGSVALRKQ